MRLPKWERLACRAALYCFWPKAVWRAEGCALWEGQSSGQLIAGLT